MAKKKLGIGTVEINKKYIDKNWIDMPNIYEKEPFDIRKSGNKKVKKIL